MADVRRPSGAVVRRLNAIGVVLTLSVAGCTYPPPESYPPPSEPYPSPGFAAGGSPPGPGYAPTPQQGVAPAGAPGYQPVAPGAAYGTPPAYGRPLNHGAPPAYGTRRAYGGPAGGITRDAFIARRREMAVRKGRDPKRAAAAAARQFDRMDTNHDDILEPEERVAWRTAHDRAVGGGTSGSQPWQEPPPR